MILMSPLPGSNWCRARLRSPRPKQLSTSPASTTPSHTDSSLESHRLPNLRTFSRQPKPNGKKEKPSLLLVSQYLKLTLRNTTYLHPKVHLTIKALDGF